jgi:hypothetical protein
VSRAARPLRRRRTVAATLAVLAAVAVGRPALAAPPSYPTQALADYVFGCMASNGQTEDAMRRCSCSIDHIAGKLNYDEYVQAETVLRMQQVPSGEDRMTMFRTSPWAQQMVDRLRQAQVEAEIRCF